MRFAAPENFAILLGVLILAIFMFYSLARKKKLLKIFGDLSLIMKNSPYISFARQRTKAILLIIALIFLTLTLTRLQFGTHLEMLEREGLDIVVAIDVSNSMMVRDMKPSRLEKAKLEILGIIERLKGDRISLVAFAGQALDYSAARFLLDAIDHSSVSVQGTSLTAALTMASKAFNQQEKKHKVLLLLTDGEDHEGGIEDAADEASRQGIKIYTVGIGNSAGEPIPILDRNGTQVGFKKDGNGEVIVSRLDETTLQKISLTTGGKYYHATAGEIELDRIFDEISTLEKKELEGTLVTRYDDRFQFPLLLVILLVTGEFFLPERKKAAGGDNA